MLYYIFGNLNPRSDSADLPLWLCMGQDQKVPLKILKTTLKYDQGMIKTNIEANVDGFKTRPRVTR